MVLVGNKVLKLAIIRRLSGLILMMPYVIH